MNCDENQLHVLISTVNGSLGLQTVTESKLEELVMAFAPVIAPDLDQDCLRVAIAKIQTSRLVQVDVGEVLAADHQPWLNDRKNDIDWKRWEAYSRLIADKGIEPQVIDAIHKRQDIILDLSGDPMKEGSWARRGLVIGDVQSGKTANYLALFNKAADAGYRAIILLAGHTDKLRKQTQTRVDEGFVGKDSRLLRQGTREIRSNHFGVGKLGVTATPFTTYSSDFSAAQVAGNNIDVASVNNPVVFVIKKNKRIIDNLVQWLNSQHNQGEQLKTPLLLLDDEADFASINTSTNPNAATAINQGIKDLLAQFEKNSYVGFTATPFANILIDDEQPEDLFPRDFIFCLDSPSNYFGPEKMQSDDDDYSSNDFMTILEDAEDSFPFKHKRDLVVQELPESLEEAIRSFFLVNAIRDIRSHEDKPRSMLINVSRFVDVQQAVFELVQQRVSTMRASLKFDQGENAQEWLALKTVFEESFSGAGATWKKVKSALLNSIEPIEVHVVNSKNAATSWDSVYATKRARVIAIGGDVLSRGLTLEGLSTSYFYRRSLSYDTLMQMGRWFGYREGYEDLCRLWIDNEVASWYSFIHEATQDLRADLKEMRLAGLTPKEFGLAVRQHPGSLLTVTAINKSRAGISVAMKVSLMNTSPETARLPLAQVEQANNWSATLDFLRNLRAQNDSELFKRNSQYWLDVPKAAIASLIGEFTPSEDDPFFGKTLATFIATAKTDILQTWDVALVSGTGDKTLALSEKHQLAARKIYRRGDSLVVGGTKMRLGGRSDLGITMEAPQLQKIEDYKLETNKDAPASVYRQHLKRPLLLIYVLQPKIHEVEAPSGYQPYLDHDQNAPLVGLHLSFPRGSADASKHDTVSYLVNKVWQRFNKGMTEFDLTDEDGIGVDDGMEG